MRVRPLPDPDPHPRPPRAPMPLRSAGNEKAARRRLINSNLMIVDQAAINVGFDFRR
jgi:hypothetical protein